MSLVVHYFLEHSVYNKIFQTIWEHCTVPGTAPWSLVTCKKAACFKLT